MLAIKVFGSSCTNCMNLKNLYKQVVSKNNIEATIKKVTELKTMMSYEIMSSPGLLVNEKVIHSDKLPTKSTLTHWLMNVEGN